MLMVGVLQGPEREETTSFAEDSTASTTILAGTNGGAGALMAQVHLLWHPEDHQPCSFTSHILNLNCGDSLVRPLVSIVKRAALLLRAA
jgi:hypothetical protein